MDDGKPILEIGVNCSWLNGTFLKQLSEPLNASAYFDSAVSVKNSSGGIVGCGQLQRHFPVYASYNGEVVFEQKSQYHLATDESWSYEIFKYSVLESIGNTCRNGAAIFDPWKERPHNVGTMKTADQLPVGNLFTGMYSYRLHVPLIGSATVLGHTVGTDQWMHFIQGEDTLATTLVTSAPFIVFSNRKLYHQ